MAKDVRATRAKGAATMTAPVDYLRVRTVCRHIASSLTAEITSKRAEALRDAARLCAAMPLVLELLAACEGRVVARDALRRMAKHARKALPNE